MFDRLAHLSVKAAIAAFLVLSLPGPALAQTCEDKARAIASRSGAQVLAVSSEGNKCVIRLLVRERGKPPRRETVVINK